MARSNGDIEKQRERWMRMKAAQAPEIQLEFDDARVTALRNWFNDEANGPDRVKRVAKALDQKGTIIFKTLKNTQKANRDASTTRKIENAAKVNGFNPNEAMGG